MNTTPWKFGWMRRLWLRRCYIVVGVPVFVPAAVLVGGVRGAAEYFVNAVQEVRMAWNA